MKNKQRGFVGIILTIILVLIGGGTYFYLINTSKINYEEQLAILGPKGISNLLNQNSTGSSGIQKEISKKILNESGDTQERIGLARILGESNTAEALETLSKVIFTTKNEELYRNSVEQLSRMSDASSEEESKQMTDIAIASYKKSAEKPELYYLFGGIIAKLGESNGVNFLRNEAIKGGLTISLLNTSKNESAKVSMELSKSIRGRLSVPTLANSLQINDPNSTEFIWSGQALSSIQFQEGAEALLNWSKNAPDNCAELAAIWLSGFRDSHSIDVMLALDISNTQYVSQKVKNEVMGAVKNYKKQYQSLINTPAPEKIDSATQKIKILKMIEDKIQNDTITIDDHVKFLAAFTILGDEKITNQWNIFITSSDMETAKKNKDILIYMLSDKKQVPKILTISIDQVRKNIIGKWQMVNDNQYLITYMGDGTYQNEGNSFNYGTWKLLTNLKEEKDAASFERELPNSVYLKINEYSNDKYLSPMYYAVSISDTENLKYDYLGTSKSFSFKRIK